MSDHVYIGTDHGFDGDRSTVIANCDRCGAYLPFDVRTANAVEQLGDFRRKHSQCVPKAQASSPMHVDDVAPAPDAEIRRQRFIKYGNQPQAEDTHGRKDDDNKPPLDLLPFDAIEGVGRVLAFGAKKYARHNWAKGMAWGRLVAAGLRHGGRWVLGEDVDADSGLSHLDHAACCFLMASALTKRGVGTDDRLVPVMSAMKGKP